MKQIVEFLQKHRTFKIYLFAFILIVVIIFSSKIYGDENIFSEGLLSFFYPDFDASFETKNFIQKILSNGVLTYLFSSTPRFITTYFVIMIASFVSDFIHFALHKALNDNQRSETILKMLYSFTKYGIAIFAGLFILTVWGVDSNTILASAGGLALVVGLGAQSLISDVLAGIFIVFEGDFNVGDIIIVDGHRGKVLAIGIRSTKVKDIYGDIKTINNSQITTFINKTKELSMADVIVGINYGESIERVEVILAQELPSLKAKIPEAEVEIQYLGVQDLNASSVDLMFVTHCLEENVMPVKRKIRREIKLIFDKHSIEIPYQHITIETKQTDEN